LRKVCMPMGSLRFCTTAPYVSAERIQRRSPPLEHHDVAQAHVAKRCRRRQPGNAGADDRHTPPILPPHRRCWRGAQDSATRQHGSERANTRGTGSAADEVAPVQARVRSDHASFAAPRLTTRGRRRGDERPRREYSGQAGTTRPRHGLRPSPPSPGPPLPSASTG